MEAIQIFDFSILNFIQEHFRCGFLDAVLGFLSYAGNAGIIWIVAAVVMLFFKKTRAAGVIALAAMGAAYLLGDWVIKPLVQRPRPFRVDSELNMFLNSELPIKKPGHYSFPSGHSAVAVAFFTVLVAKHKRLALIALVPVLLMMFSRLYNYVHFPTDILCGALLGVLVALLVLMIFRKTKLEGRLSPQK